MPQLFKIENRLGERLRRDRSRARIGSILLLCLAFGASGASAEEGAAAAAEVATPAATPTAPPAPSSMPSPDAGSGQSLMEQRLAEIPTGEEGVNQMMGTLDERLELTAEQEKQIRPLVEEAAKQMELSRDRFVAGEITPMALMMQLQMAGQKSTVQIEPLLDETQLAEYQAMQLEQKRAIMQEMQKAAASGMGGM